MENAGSIQSSNGAKIQFTLRDVIYLSSVLISAVGLYYAGHEVNAIQQQQIDANTRDIVECRRVLNDLNPKVERTDWNVQSLMKGRESK